MALRLTWTNRNVIANAVNVYRGDTALDPANLPAPLATISNGDAFYVDQTAESGKTYYYILGTKTANDLILTPNQKILVADNRGAGPANLLWGDDTLGYYGTLLAVDFFSNANILAAAKTTSGLPSALVAPVWHKMTRNGKIIYVPESTFGVVTWNALYAAGLVFGVDGNVAGDALVPATPVNQLVKLSLNGEDYKVRLMRGYRDGSYLNIPVTGAVNMDDLANSENNEYSDLLYGICNLVPEKQRTINFAEVNAEVFLGAAASENSASSNIAPRTNASRFFMQERDGNGYAVTRGNRSISWVSVSPTTKAHLASIYALLVTASATWLPVIELIEPTATLNA